MEEKKINVVYFFRKPFAGYFSIEELFGFIKSTLPEGIESTSYYLRRHSKGLKQRLLSCIEVINNQGDINHITGDVHFISFFMHKNKTVLTIHDLEVLKRLKGMQRLIIKLFWYTIPAKRVKYITVISEFTKQELLKVIKINPEKVVVIHNSISPEIKFTPKPFNSAKPNVLHVGTAHNKNLERLIEAIDGLNVKLTILGQLKEHHLDLLKKHGIEYENYFSLPYSHVIRHYQEADIVSFVSLYEGFGLPIIEANAIGRPVITSNCTSMPEVAGEAALLVNPYDVKEIRQAIQKIIEDDKLRNRLIEYGRKNTERFQPAFIANKYAKLYFKMMNKQRTKI
ncbi:MAG: glycosyltransferase family 1 protein [Lentimicrobium sp.]|jgi:glycosyltransferase involved in cell wall biosynthesis|nr:glycosyltransferase family 1 protein [Lentimicrobium sp.]